MRRPETYFATVFNRLTSIKNIDLYTKHAIICHPCATSHNESDCHVMKKIRRMGMSCELISALGNHISNII